MVAIAMIIVAIKFLFSSSSSTKADVSMGRSEQRPVSIDLGVAERVLIT